MTFLLIYNTASKVSLNPLKDRFVVKTKFDSEFRVEISNLCRSRATFDSYHKPTFSINQTRNITPINSRVELLLIVHFPLRTQQSKGLTPFTNCFSGSPWKQPFSLFWKHRRKQPSKTMQVIRRPRIGKLILPAFHTVNITAKSYLVKENIAEFIVDDRAVPCRPQEDELAFADAEARCRELCGVK